MARFVRNRAFEREIGATPGFQKGLAQTTLRVADAIENAAQPFRDTGQYIRKVKARKTRVYLEPHFAHIAEFGSVNNPPQANVRRGVKAAGLRYEDSGPTQAE
jgi:hypothetical protein